LPAEPFTQFTGSIVDHEFVAAHIAGVDAVLHAATLHKPHVASHSRRDFVDTNIIGTLNLLEAAHRAGVSAFVFTSTTSAFGNALTPPHENEHLGLEPNDIREISITYCGLSTR
jgi:UDP-glucose 4-epimerase